MTPLDAVPSIPRQADGPVFREPWEAKAFALTIALHERGLFTWPEWTEALGRCIAASEPDDGSRYYEAWLAALEEIVRRKGVG